MRPVVEKFEPHDIAGQFAGLRASPHALTSAYGAIQYDDVIEARPSPPPDGDWTRSIPKRPHDPGKSLRYRQADCALVDDWASTKSCSCALISTEKAEQPAVPERAANPLNNVDSPR